MSLDIKIRNLEAMSLVVTSSPEEDEAIVLLDEFLSSNNIANARRFSTEMTIRKRGHENIIYIKYAQVPEGTSGMNNASIINLPQSDYLYIQLTKEEYKNMNLAEVGAYMKENNLEFDFSKVMALVEDIVQEGQKMKDVYIYVNHK